MLIVHVVYVSKIHKQMHNGLVVECRMPNKEVLPPLGYVFERNTFTLPYII